MKTWLYLLALLFAVPAFALNDAGWLGGDNPLVNGTPLTNWIAYAATNNEFYTGGSNPSSNNIVVSNTIPTFANPHWSNITTTIIGSTPAPLYIAPSGTIWIANAIQSNHFVIPLLSNLPPNTITNTITSNICISGTFTGHCVAVSTIASNWNYASGLTATNSTTNMVTNVCGFGVVCISTNISTTITVDACLAALLSTNSVMLTQQWSTVAAISNPCGAVIAFPWANASFAIDCAATNVPQLAGQSYQIMQYTNVTMSGTNSITNVCAYTVAPTNFSINLFNVWAYNTAVAAGERELVEGDSSGYRLALDSDTSDTAIGDMHKGDILGMAQQYAIKELADTNGSFATWCARSVTNWIWVPGTNCLGAITADPNAPQGYDCGSLSTVGVWVPQVTHPPPPVWLLADNGYQFPPGTTVNPFTYANGTFTPNVGPYSPPMSMDWLWCEVHQLPIGHLSFIVTNWDDAQPGWYNGNMNVLTQAAHAFLTTNTVPYGSWFGYTGSEHFWQLEGATNPPICKGHIVSNTWTIAGPWLDWGGFYLTGGVFGIVITNTSTLITNSLEIDADTHLNIQAPYYSNGFTFYGITASNNALYTLNINSTTNWQTYSTNRFTPGVIVPPNCTTNLYTFPVTNIVGGVTNIAANGGTNITTDCFFTNTLSTALNIIGESYQYTLVNTGVSTNFLNTIGVQTSTGIVSMVFTNQSFIQKIVTNLFTVTGGVTNDGLQNIILSCIVSNAATNITIGVTVTNWPIASGFTELQYDPADGMRQSLNSLVWFWRPLTTLPPPSPTWYQLNGVIYGPDGTVPWRYGTNMVADCGLNTNNFGTIGPGTNYVNVATNGTTNVVVSFIAIVTTDTLANAESLIVFTNALDKSSILTTNVDTNGVTNIVSSLPVAEVQPYEIVQAVAPGNLFNKDIYSLSGYTWSIPIGDVIIYTIPPWSYTYNCVSAADAGCCTNPADCGFGEPFTSMTPCESFGFVTCSSNQFNCTNSMTITIASCADLQTILNANPCSIVDTTSGNVITPNILGGTFEFWHGTTPTNNNFCCQDSGGTTAYVESNSWTFLTNVTDNLSYAYSQGTNGLSPSTALAGVIFQLTQQSSGGAFSDISTQFGSSVDFYAQGFMPAPAQILGGYVNPNIKPIPASIGTGTIFTTTFSNAPASTCSNFVVGTLAYYTNGTFYTSGSNVTQIVTNLTLSTQGQWPASFAPLLVDIQGNASWGRITNAVGKTNTMGVSTWAITNAQFFPPAVDGILYGAGYSGAIIVDKRDAASGSFTGMPSRSYSP